MPAGSLPEGSSSFAPSAVSFPAGLAGGQDGGEDVPKLPAQLARRDQGVELRHPRGVPVTAARVDREHSRGLAHAHLVFAGELPVDVAGQRGEVGDPRHVRLLLQDRLVQVGDAPALRHGEVEERRQLGAGLAGDVVPPGAERHQQLPLDVQGYVPVHHPAQAHGRDGLQLQGVAGAHVLDERRVAGGQALPDVLHVVRPDAVLELVLPGMRARRQRRRVGRDEGGLDAGRAELDPEDGATRPDQLRRATLLLVHRILLGTCRPCPPLALPWRTSLLSVPKSRPMG